MTETRVDVKALGHDHPPTLVLVVTAHRGTSLMSLFAQAMKNFMFERSS
jgi:hypothetical protein